MNLIFLYGPPGVGKLTVGQSLAKKTDYKLFHGHVLIDALHQVFEYGSKGLTELKERIWLEIFEEATEDPSINGIIFTYVYGKDVDDIFIKQVIDTLDKNQSNVYFVLLSCDQQELLKRVTNPSREIYTKMKDPNAVSELMAKYTLTDKIPHKDSLQVDTTNLPPDESAQKIIDHFNL